MRSEYAMKDHEGDDPKYAQQFRARRGRGTPHWQTKEGEEPSPWPSRGAGTDEDMDLKLPEHPIFNGYYYRMPKQGNMLEAPMTILSTVRWSAVAVVPSSDIRGTWCDDLHRQSRRRGLSKDLGRTLKKVAKAMKTFDPDAS
jgi:hypothetical protein